MISVRQYNTGGEWKKTGKLTPDQVFTYMKERGKAITVAAIVTPIIEKWTCKVKSTNLLDYIGHLQI